jgi:hypothetical protein
MGAGIIRLSATRGGRILSHRIAAAARHQHQGQYTSNCMRFHSFALSFWAYAAHCETT